MSKIARLTLPIGAVLALAGTAYGADLTSAELKAYMFGKTVYLESMAASVSGKSGQSVIYWAEDGTALNKTPDGSMMHGKTEIRDNKTCTDWKERPGTACVRWEKQGDVVSLIDEKSGAVRAKVVKTAPGNAEKLAP